MADYAEVISNQPVVIDNVCLVGGWSEVTRDLEVVGTMVRLLTPEALMMDGRVHFCHDGTRPPHHDAFPCLLSYPCGCARLFCVRTFHLHLRVVSEHRPITVDPVVTGLWHDEGWVRAR